ncbi:MAG: helix-turn-helix domain-containing protein [Chloroflexota bacterium]|nr:helix-turn-helix domain-containing protein [Chloroflexota bacterium]
MTEERWYTVEEIVDLLKVHEQTVRRWLRDGQLRGVLLGRKAGYRVRAADLDAFLEERETGAEAGKTAA